MGWRRERVTSGEKSCQDEISGVPVTAEPASNQSGPPHLIPATGTVAYQLERKVMNTKETKVDSTSDDRTVNNVMRHAYRVLSDTEKEQMRLLEDKGLEFFNLLHTIGETDPAGNKLASRELSLAATKAEEAFMWAVKHITK